MERKIKELWDILKDMQTMVIQGEERQKGRAIQTRQPWLKFSTESGISEDTKQGKRQSKLKKKCTSEHSIQSIMKMEDKT